MGGSRGYAVGGGSSVMTIQMGRGVRVTDLRDVIDKDVAASLHFVQEYVMPPLLFDKRWAICRRALRALHHNAWSSSVSL